MASPHIPSENPMWTWMRYRVLQKQALKQVEDSQTSDERARNLENLRNLNEARSQRLQAISSPVAAFVPLLALVVTAIALVYQSKQFKTTLIEQQKQSWRNQKQRREASEDAQWREALKLVSFKDQASSQVGLFAMQGFFSSERHGAQARTIASVILPNITNVNAFDEVMSRIFLSPKGWRLSGVILEGQEFDGLDFADANLSYGILYDASFKNAKFNQAELINVYVRNVTLDGADFGGVTRFSGSRWENSNWWKAKCIPQSLLDYLLKTGSQPLTSNERSALVSGCL